MITIPTNDFVGTLNDVLPFASTDAELPILQCVRLEWDGKQLHALATDRYRIGWATWRPGDIEPDAEAQDDLFADWGSTDDPWQVTIPLDEARELAKVFKLPAKEGVAAPVTIDRDPSRGVVKFARSRDTGHSAITIDVPDTLMDFPDVRELLRKTDQLKPMTGLGFTARYLADFAKVREHGPMRMRFTGAETLVHVTIGDRFVGAIVPVRIGEVA